MMAELKKCPFCGSDHTDRWTWISKLEKEEERYVLTHYCQPNDGNNFTTITIYSNSKEDVIGRWNNRGKKYPADQ